MLRLAQLALIKVGKSAILGLRISQKRKRKK